MVFEGGLPADKVALDIIGQKQYKIYPAPKLLRIVETFFYQSLKGKKP